MMIGVAGQRLIGRTIMVFSLAKIKYNLSSIGNVMLDVCLALAPR